MRIVVAGSDGFVGRNVCRLLESEKHVVIKIDISQGFDLCDSSTIDIIGPVDCFIHLANLVYVPGSYEEPAKYYRVNYLTTLNALETCRKWNAKLVYISSYIYGVPQYLPVDELHPVCPFNPYAQTKFICEKLCEGYQRDFGVKISLIRPFNIYGIGQNGKLLIPEIIAQLKSGKNIINLKESTPRRDYINVVDLAKAIMLCAETDCPIGPYNVCSGKSISVLEITEIINKYLNSKVIFNFSSSDRHNEVYETRGAYENLKALGWAPSISFEDGIKAIIEAEKL